MRPNPKFKAGDRVKIVNQEDPLYGRTAVIAGLSPSTQKKRTPGSLQWRYDIETLGDKISIYIDEKHLEKESE